MTIRSVHWHEGMELLPQHMQLAQRFAHLQFFRSHKWDVHYNWGLRSFEYDRDALLTQRLVIRQLEARLRDGTLVSVPEEAALPAVELAEPLQLNGSVTVFLAVPLLQAGRGNVPDEAGVVAAEPGQIPLQTRFTLDSQDLEDENTGTEPQAIRVRLLNLKLLLSTQDHGGYEVLPIARIEKAPQPPHAPQLDLTYIPPVLACDAWKPLQEGILQTVFNRMGQKLEGLAQQVVTRGITHDTRNPGDNMILAQLDALNEACALWNTLAFAEGVHPLLSYLEMCRLAGQMAIFTPVRKTPDLPRYDHDDLGGCFYRVKHYLDGIEITEAEYEERAFIGEGLRMQVTMEPKWLEPAFDMYVGVQCPLPAEECIRLLTKRGQLDMKIGSAQRVDEIFDRGAQGLEFTPSAKPPRALPAQADLVFFQVNRASQKDEWDHVRKTLALAIRLNQTRIVGTVQGQRTLNIKSGDKTAPWQFTLFLVPHED